MTEDKLNYHRVYRKEHASVRAYQKEYWARNKERINRIRKEKYYDMKNSGQEHKKRTEYDIESLIEKEEKKRMARELAKQEQLRLAEIRKREKKDHIKIMNDMWGKDGWEELPYEELITMNEKENKEYCRRMWLNEDGPAVFEYMKGIIRKLQEERKNP